MTVAKFMKVQPKPYMAMEKSILEQVLPCRESGLWILSFWSSCIPKGWWSIDKSTLPHMDRGPVCNPKLEEGQGEECIATLNPMVWSKGMRAEHCNGNTFKLL